jgi:hypothetical protein
MNHTSFKKGSRIRGSKMMASLMANRGEWIGNYTVSDLKAIWHYCREDFEDFIGILAWLETLTPEKRLAQLSAAHDLMRARVKV